MKVACLLQIKKTISKERLTKRDLVSLLDYYLQGTLWSQVAPPYDERTYGGVRGGSKFPLLDRFSGGPSGWTFSFGGTGKNYATMEKNHGG